jgi:hypothetical protein
MRGFTVALGVMWSLSLQLSAQEIAGSLDRISFAVQDDADPKEAPRALTVSPLSASIFEPSPGAVKLGPFTLIGPKLPGEIIRLSLPIGDYVSRSARWLAAINRRSKEAAARRRVQADLKALAEWQLANR